MAMENNGFLLTEDHRGRLFPFAISTQIANDDDYPIQQYDRVLFNPKRSIPVEFEGDNRLFVIPVEDVVAVFRKE